MATDLSLLGSTLSGRSLFPEPGKFPGRAGRQLRTGPLGLRGGHCAERNSREPRPVPRSPAVPAPCPPGRIQPGGRAAPGRPATRPVRRPDGAPGGLTRRCRKARGAFVQCVDEAPAPVSPGCWRNPGQAAFGGMEPAAGLARRTGGTRPGLVWHIDSVYKRVSAGRPALAGAAPHWSARVTSREDARRQMPGRPGGTR
jgi:hypothetical protein